MPVIVNRLRSPKWITILLLPVILAAFCYYTMAILSTHEPLRNRNIVLLIAHPDDEAMFFAPTLRAITKPELGNKVQVICFSKGNAEGLGELRAAELLTSASILGVKSVQSRVIIHDHPDLPDSMTTSWPKETISSLLSENMKAFNTNPTQPVDTFITFDNGGISNHPNHISLLHAATYFISHNNQQDDIMLYTLTTVPIYRKYLSIFDAFITASLGNDPEVDPTGYSGSVAPRSLLFLSSWKDYRKSQQAMTEGHRSQMVWFRWGWISLSRYMVFNALERINVQELDVEKGDTSP